MYLNNNVSDENTSLFGWGVQASGRIEPCDYFVMYFNGVYGKGITPYIQDLTGSGLDFTPNPANAEQIQTMPMWSWQVAGQVNIIPSTLFASGGYSTVRVNHSNGYFAETQYKRGTYIFGNVFYQVNPNMRLALEYLHSKHIIHRDIKLLNIFMAKDKVIKIGDFGMSKLLKHKEMKMSRVGTPLYLAPELVKKEKYDYKADIWSLGCSLYHLAKTVPPFNDDNLIRLGYAIVNTEPERLPECYSKDFDGFVKKMMTKNSKERPSAEMCIKLIPDKVKVKYLNRVKIKDEIHKEDGVQFRKTVTSGFDFRHVGGGSIKQGFEHQYKSGYSTSASSGVCKDSSLGFAGKKINMSSRGFPHRKYFQLRHHNIIVSKSSNNAISITTAMSGGNSNTNNSSMKKLLVNNNNNEMIIHKAKPNVNPLSGMKLQNKTTSYFYKPKLPLDNNSGNSNSNNNGNVIVPIVPVIPIIKNDETTNVIDNTALYNKYIKKDSCCT
jgi:serine/threonine protein kinase